MVEEEVRHATVEHDDLDVGVAGQLVDDLHKTENRLADDEVHGRIREGDFRYLR